MKIEGALRQTFVMKADCPKAKKPGWDIMVAITWKGSKLKLYLNGKLVRP